MAAVVAIAGRVLSLYDPLQPAAGTRSLDLMHTVLPPPPPSIYGYFTAELL